MLGRSGLRERLWDVSIPLGGKPMNTEGWIKVIACPEEGLGPRRGTHYELLEDHTWRPAAVILNGCDGGQCHGRPDMQLG